MIVIYLYAVVENGEADVYLTMKEYLGDTKIHRDEIHISSINQLRDYLHSKNVVSNFVALCGSIHVMNDGVKEFVLTFNTDTHVSIDSMLAVCLHDTQETLSRWQWDKEIHMRISIPEFQESYRTFVFDHTGHTLAEFAMPDKGLVLYDNRFRSNKGYGKAYSMYACDYVWHFTTLEHIYDSGGKKDANGLTSLIDHLKMENQYLRFVHFALVGHIETITASRDLQNIIGNPWCNPWENYDVVQTLLALTM